jgi:hypothetical protein
MPTRVMRNREEYTSRDSRTRGVTFLVGDMHRNLVGIVQDREREGAMEDG